MSAYRSRSGTHTCISVCSSLAKSAVPTSLILYRRECTLTMHVRQLGKKELLEYICQGTYLPTYRKLKSYDGHECMI